MDTIEKMEKRRDELIEMLGRTQIGTETYDKIVDELDAISRMINADRKTEIERLNNNERNDNDRARLEIEAEKIKVEKAKIKAGFADNIWNGLICLGYTGISYQGDKIAYAIQSIKRLGEKFLPGRKR